jgi:hypothetical protein
MAFRMAENSHGGPCVPERQRPAEASLFRAGRPGRVGGIHRRGKVPRACDAILHALRTRRRTIRRAGFSLGRNARRNSTSGAKVGLRYRLRSIGILRQ